MDAAQAPLRSIVMRFAEIIDEVGKRLHVGCVMAAGQDWVEVSLPEHTQLGAGLRVRFLPSTVLHGVSAGWRASDRVGFTYVSGGPPEDQFAGIPGLLDPRPASVKIHR
jgi:hypothetical protein